MKMKPEHLAHIKQAIAKHDNDFNRTLTWALCHSDKRYRWDLLYRAVSSAWICDNLYPYLNDDHIDTALRSLVKPLEQA